MAEASVIKMHSPHEHTTKDNHIALKYRLDGNYFFRLGRFFEAMENYNKSICYAELDSDMLALGYGNRSAIYCTVELYDLCLENIEMARAITANPENNIQVLNEREEKVKRLKMLSKENPENDPFTFFKLSYPPRPNNPYVAGCLEIRENAKYGRHVVTNRDLKPGDIVVMEETPFKGLEKSGAYLRCANCFKSNKMSLIPMETCASAMFCSKKCLDYGKDKYMCATDEEFHIFPRILVTMVDAVGGDMRRLKQLIQDPELAKKKILEYDISNPEDPNFLLYQFYALNALFKGDMGVKLQHIINDHPILERWTSAEDKEVAKAFLSHVADYVNNGIGYDWWELTFEGDKIVPKSMSHRTTMRIGNGIFPFSSFFSHACSFNAERLAIDNKFVIFIRLPIKKNEQIFITYGSNFDVEDKRKRRASIKSKFGFECTCDACEKNWTRCSKLPKLERSYKDPGLTVNTIAEARAEMAYNVEYIARNFNKYPYFEYVRLLERNFLLLSVIGRLEPCLF